VAITVHDYQQASAAQLLEQVDGVVFAGGPLMDLPKQLVKHLYTVALARRAGKPFVIEGIGAGPFIRTASAWTARLLVRMAERITVRTEADARQPLVRGLGPLVGRDPAFDYLETRRDALTRVATADRLWLDRLFKGTDGRTTIGINLRPLRADYTVGTPAARRAEYTRMVEARFEERLADAMTRFHRASAEPPCFIFYPMNAIQFGSSDLRSAYRVKRLLGADVDLRVWEGDPSIDGVVALLRRVDVAITMRFHATIYALSQGTRVIGVDYRPGKKDKVAALLEDAGHGEHCRRIDEMTADWMFEQLVEQSQPRITIGDARPPRTVESSPRPVQPPVPT
jgi:polysaccharide pyruvyl transferase WcaK-like protein